MKTEQSEYGEKENIQPELQISFKGESIEFPESGDSSSVQERKVLFEIVFPLDPTESSVSVSGKIVHLGEISHQCPHCNNTFSLAGNLKVHVKSVHLGDKPHHCPHCNTLFSQSSQLKGHVKSVHWAERSYQCPHCITAFRTSSNLT